MLLGTGTDLWYITHLPAPYGAAAAACAATYAGAFVLAKALVHGSGLRHAGNLPHMLTHAGATLLHVGLLYATSGRGGGVAVAVAPPSWLLGKGAAGWTS